METETSTKTGTATDANTVLADVLSLSEAAELLRWYKKLSPAQKCTVHPPAGSGGSTGLYNLTEEDLIKEWRRKR